jgi:hypothetical protein
MNQAGSFKRSGLTKQQKAEQEAAIYGLTPQHHMQLSHDEIERMRQIVQQHDAQSGTSRNGIREFDLNKPPQERYVYREFPKVLYHHDSRIHTTVHNKEQERIKLNDGFVTEPYLNEEPEIEVDLGAEDAAEAAQLTKQARTKKKSQE